MLSLHFLITQMVKRRFSQISRPRKVTFKLGGRPIRSFRMKRKGRSLLRQVKALVASKKREAADVARTTAAQAATTIACLTSSTDFATAASGTGLLNMDGDECMINHVRIKGTIANTTIVDADPTGNTESIMRKLLVWFNKPLLVSSAAGTLPPITEVLIADTIQSLFVTQAANGGRFVVLSDKKWNLGSNTVQAATALGSSSVNGKTRHYYDYKVKVGRMCKFVGPSVSGVAVGDTGGHYDNTPGGQVDKGLLVLYTQVALGVAGAVLNDTSSTRLNYTG